METLADSLIHLLAGLRDDVAPAARLDRLIEGVNQWRPDLTLKWMVGRSLPADAGPSIAELALDGIAGHVVLESCPENFGEQEIGAIREALRVLQLLIDPAPLAPVLEITPKGTHHNASCHSLCLRSPDTMVLCDELGRILQCNQAFAAQMSGQAAAFVGRSLGEVLRERGNGGLLASALADVYASGKTVRADYELPGGRGPVVSDCVLCPVADEAGHIYAVLVTGRDVTDWRRREQQLEARIAEAETANHARDEFLSLLSHELRTPLTPIIAGIDSIKQTIASALPTAAGDLAIVEQNVQTEVRLIDDLLDLARISRGGLSLRLDTIDAHQIIEEALAMCQSDLVTKRLEIHRELSAGQTLVRADPGRLRQVFWHLIKNAAKFTPIGGSVTISTSNDSSLSDSTATLVCRVTDTGLGIDRARLPRLFDGLATVSHTRPGGGLGVGLLIARSVVRLHGGTLEGFSEGRGKGAVFTVRLQVTQAPAEAASEPHPNPGRSLRVLLVEDHRDTARILAKLLDAMGHRVTIAATVADAMKVGESGEFDLLISDLGLPDGSGHDLGALLTRYPHMRGIVVSGFGDEEDIRRSIQAGFSVHLTKPVDLQVLRRHIHAMAEQV